MSTANCEAGICKENSKVKKKLFLCQAEVRHIVAMDDKEPSIQRWLGPLSLPDEVRPFQFHLMF
jgi:hypothetical protein